MPRSCPPSDSVSRICPRYPSKLLHMQRGMEISTCPQWLHQRFSNLLPSPLPHVTSSRTFSNIATFDHHHAPPIPTPPRSVIALFPVWCWRASTRGECSGIITENSAIPAPYTDAVGYPVATEASDKGMRTTCRFHRLLELSVPSKAGFLSEIDSSKLLRTKNSSVPESDSVAVRLCALHVRSVCARSVNAVHVPTQVV